MSKLLETSIEKKEDSETRLVCLGIESTAHTFGVSIVESKGRTFNILSDAKEIYRPEEGKGIHPREASKHHAQKASSIILRVLNESGLSLVDVDAIAFSQGPGLGPCLRIGAVVARTLSAYYQKPLIPVNHAVAHIELAKILTGAIDPLVLLVSGGHTVIVALSFGRWRILGETLDITIGQLIDQFGREAGYSSPFGREFEQISCKSTNYIDLPYTVKGNDVSFSGLLTAAKKLLKEGIAIEDICFSLQETSFAMLVESVERALSFTEKKGLLLAGGVAANKTLQNMLKSMCQIHDSEFLSIQREYSGDCGAQIALNGLQLFKGGMNIDISNSSVRQSWRLDEVDVIW